MNIVTITGWGQQLDSLDEFANQFGNVENIPYVNYLGIDDLFSNIKKNDIKCDVLMGWSLGAQLATRIVAAKALAPKLVILIAPPYQYVRSETINLGIHPIAFNTFKAAYSTFPSNTLRKFVALMCQNDDHAMNIIATMDDEKKHHKGWLMWLDELAHFSCEQINFSNFPKTIIFHGDGDAITSIEQGKMFHKVIKDSRFEALRNCGHAPHLHNPEFVSAVIKEEIENGAF